MLFTFLDMTLHSPKHASFGNGNAPDGKITLKLKIESHEISQDIKMLNLNINGWRDVKVTQTLKELNNKLGLAILIRHTNRVDCLDGLK